MYQAKLTHLTAVEKQLQNCATTRRDMKKLTSFSDSGHRFPLEEPILYFTAKSCWLE